MQIGIVGLGKTGATLSRQLARKGHEVFGFDPGSAAEEKLADEGIATFGSLEELVGTLSAPRVVLLMVPPGAPTDETIDTLGGLCATGDVIIDGGHSNYQQAPLVARALATRGIDFVDLGLSGGVWALEMGYCLMVGGSDQAVGRVEPLLVDLAADGGYAHVGPVGSGHFLKLVHNGIECALMEAYGESFAIMEATPEFHFDLAEVDAIWRHGSLAHSWSLALTKQALRPGSDKKEAERRSRVIGLRDRYRSYRGSVT